MKIILHAKGTKRDVTVDVLGELISLPHHFFRRSELLSLISSNLGIQPNHICAWTDYTLQPGFFSHINPITPVCKQISASIPTPSEAEDILRDQQTLIRTIPGDYKNSHLSRLNWMVDPRINEIHISSYEDLMESVGDNRESYIVRVYPWCLGLNKLSIEDFLNGDGPDELTIEDVETIQTRLKNIIPRLTEDLLIDPTLSLIKCEYRTTRINTKYGTTDHLGFPTENPLHPFSDYSTELDIGRIFQSLDINKNANMCHSIAYCDPNQPTNTKVRIATTDDRDGTVLQSVLSKKMIQYFKNPIIRRSKIQVPYEEPKEPYLRVVYSLRGVNRGKPIINDSLLSEAIVYSDGSVYSVINNPLHKDNLIIHTKIIETITGTTLRPITKECIFQLETGIIFKRSFNNDQKKKYLETRLLLDETIARPIETDDPIKDRFRMRYNRVNLPETFSLTKVFTQEIIRKMVTIMILANIEPSEMISQIEEKKITPGKVLEAIGLLPPDKEAGDYRSYIRQNKLVLRQALDIYASEMDREREEKELERVRAEEGSEDMVPDIQFSDDNKGGVTIYGFGCPNLLVVDTILRYITNSFIEETTDFSKLSRLIPKVPPKVSTEPSPMISQEALDFLDKQPPSITKEPTPPPAQVPIEGEEETKEDELDLDLDDEPTPPPAQVPIEGEEETKEDELDLDLDDEPSPPPEKEPTPSPAQVSVQPEEDELDLDLDDEPSPPPEKESTPLPFSSGGSEREKEDESLDSQGSKDSIAFGRHPIRQSGRGRVIGDDTLYNQGYPINRLRNKPLTETDAKTKRTRYASTSAFRDIYEKDIFGDLYARFCRKGLQPIMITKEEYERFKKERPGSFGYMNALDNRVNSYITSDDPNVLRDHYQGLQTEDDEDLWAVPYEGAWFICPKYWSMSEEIPLYREEVKDKDVFNSRLKAKDKNKNRGKDIYLSYDYATEPPSEDKLPSRINFPGYRKDGKPCCFKVTQPNAGQSFEKLRENVLRKIKKQQTPKRDIRESSKFLPKRTSIITATDEVAGTTMIPSTPPESVKDKITTTQKVQEDLRWNSSKDYLLPGTEVLELISMTGFQDRCGDMLRKYKKNLESICLVRKPDPVNYYYDSLFRSILTIYHFTRGAMNKENHLNTPRELAESIVRFVSAEQYRTLQGGSLMRLFLPNDTEISKYLKTKSETFLNEWVETNILPDQFRERFMKELDDDEPSDFLIRWAVSHTRFIEHTLDDKEPKSLNVYWEILTKHPWNILNEQLGGKSSLANGINLFVIERSEPPFLVCPPEGRITNYFDENRPMGIIIRDEMVYQALVLMTRHDTIENKKKKETHKVQGLIYPNTSDLKERSPEMLALIRDLWKSVRGLPNHMKKQCAPESISPYSSTPTHEEVITTLETLTGYVPNALVMDSIGRITGVSYPITPTPVGVSAASGEGAKRIIIPTKPVASDVLPSLPIISGSEDTASYKEIKGWLQDIVELYPEHESKFVKSLKKLRPVIKKDLDSLSVVGIQINDALITPVSDLEKYTPGTLPEEFKNAIVSGWSNETDDILSIQPSGMRKVRNMIQESVRKTINNAMEDIKFTRQLSMIRNDRSVERQLRIQGIYEILEDMDELVYMPDSVKDKDRDTIKQRIIERVANVLISPLVSEQFLKNIVQLSKVRFPDTADKEIHLTYSDLYHLRDPMLTILQSKYVKGTETFAIGGANDPNYISSSTRNTPIPIRNLWGDKLSFNVNTSIAIRSRDGILKIRMYPTGNRPRDSWDAIAISMRDHMRDPNFNGNDLREKLIDIWNNFFDEFGEDSWDKVKKVLRKETRGMIEDDYASITSFLLGLRTGRIDPGWSDLCLITKALRLNFIILHGYSIGEESSMVRLPLRVIARSPINWNELQYSILMRTPDRTEPGRYIYNPIVGVRKERNVFGFKISKNHVPGNFVKMVEKIAESGTMPRWTNPTLRKWTSVYFGIIKRA